MAQAHSDVAFSFSITHEGVCVTYDQEALYDVWLSYLRSLRLRIGRLINNVLVGVFPASLSSLAISIWGYIALYFTRDTFNHGIDLSFGFIDSFKNHVNLQEPA